MKKPNHMTAANKGRLMSIGVPHLVEAARGCGYRKPGGYYLRSDGLLASCGKLPLKLGVCPTCGEGIRFSMAPRWVNPVKLFENQVCGNKSCVTCPLGDANIAKLGQCLLLWIGEKFYPTTDKYIKEVLQMGVSRRVKAVPRNFEVNKTTVLLAHLKGTHEVGDTKDSVVFHPAVFHAFQANRIEYVCTGDETDDEIDKMRSRGLVPVIVEREETMDALDDLEE